MLCCSIVQAAHLCCIDAIRAEVHALVSALNKVAVHKLAACPDVAIRHAQVSQRLCQVGVEAKELLALLADALDLCMAGGCVLAS